MSLSGGRAGLGSPAAPRRVRRAQAMVEFALVLVILLALVSGIMEVSRLMLISAELQNAAREGAHYAAFHPADTAGVQQAALAGLIVADRSAVVVQAPTYPGNGRCLYCPVQVTVSYVWTSAVAFVPDASRMSLRPLGPLTLSGTSIELIENDGSGGP